MSSSPVTPTLSSAIQAALGYAAQAESAMGATLAAASAAATSATNSETAAELIEGVAVTVANALASVQGIANTVLLAQQNVQGVALQVNGAVTAGLDAFIASNPVEALVVEAAASCRSAAAGSATSAAGSVTTAAGSATAAATSATNAASSATAAASSATTAGTDATNAASSASAAAASAASLTTAVTSVIGNAGAVTATQIQTGLNALSGGPTLTLNTASTGATQSVNNNTTALATTAFVLAQASSASPIIDSTAAAGSATTFARGDHVHPSDTSRLATSGGKLTGAIGFATIASVASASTVDLGAQTSNVVSITGTTTVNSFGSTATSGSAFLVTFAGALTLTYNATSMILPGAASITTAAGDSCFAVCEGSGNWAVSLYQQASGRALVAPSISQLPTDVLTSSINFVISGGGASIQTGLQGWLQCPFPGTIQSVTLLGDQSGSITVDIWKCTYSAYAPGTHPVAGDSITASAVPAIASSGVKFTDSTLSGWTTTINAGDILAFNVKVAAVNIQTCTIALKVAKT